MFAPAFAAIRAANDGSVPEEKLRAAFAECWRVAFEAVADKYGFLHRKRLLWGDTSAGAARPKQSQWQTVEDRFASENHVLL